MLWLLDISCFDNLDSLKSSILKNGDSYLECKYVPFAFNVIPVGDIHGSHKDGYCFAYGSLSFIKHLKNSELQKYNPISYCNLETLACSYYYPRLQQYLLNDMFILLPYGCIEYLSDFDIFYAISYKKIFIRPNSGWKHFPGSVIDIDDINKFGEYYQISKETLCLISSPQEITAEYRFVIKNNDIVTFSAYKGQSDKIDDGIEFVKNILSNSNFEPDIMWTLDIAESYRRWKLIEINSMSCSGYYDCDTNKIVKEVKKSIIEECNG